jgi:nitric oxide reductase subunit B
VQWKALGSMVGSWNMLVYGSGFFIMEKMSGDKTLAKKPVSFFFFFLGLTNLMFNWGHHTYIVPAAPWVKTVAYVISMTELLILGQIIFQWRKTMSKARQNFHRLPYRLMSFADFWIFLNLTVAIGISIPAINIFTHGTHITVAHAMGATIGINTMILFGAVFFVIRNIKPVLFSENRRVAGTGTLITNIALVFFWISLLGSGLVKISSQLHNEPFYKMMQSCVPMFKLFAVSGFFVLIGIIVMITAALRSILLKEKASVLQVQTVEPAGLATASWKN